MNDTIYRGEKTDVGYLVTVNGVELRSYASQKVQFYAKGFSWGYSGAGPLQLALAILLDVLGDPERALKHYRWYCAIGPMMWSDSWATSAAEVMAIVDDLEDRSDRRTMPSVDVVKVDGPQPLVVKGGVA